MSPWVLRALDMSIEEVTIMLQQVFLTLRRGPVCVLAFLVLISISATARAQHYNQTNLVSDVPGLAPTTDATVRSATANTTPTASPNVTMP